MGAISLMVTSYLCKSTLIEILCPAQQLQVRVETPFSSFHPAPAAVTDLTPQTKNPVAACATYHMSPFQLYIQRKGERPSAETGFCHIGQAGLELLASSDLPTLGSQNAENYRYGKEGEEGEKIK
ncbi:hypothetical protein AAY473_031569 [Plecturocebus cupreus]